MFSSIKLSDLTSGMRVTYRNGEARIVLKAPAFLDVGYITDCPTVLTNIPKHGDGGVKNKFCDVSAEYDSTLIHKTNRDWDIMKVEIPVSKFRMLSLNDADYVAVWIRKEAKKMTVADVARALGYDVEIVEG